MKSDNAKSGVFTIMWALRETNVSGSWILGSMLVESDGSDNHCFAPCFLGMPTIQLHMLRESFLKSYCGSPFFSLGWKRSIV